MQAQRELSQWLIASDARQSAGIRRALDGMDSETEEEEEGGHEGEEVTATYTEADGTDPVHAIALDALDIKIFTQQKMIMFFRMLGELGHLFLDSNANLAYTCPRTRERFVCISLRPWTIWVPASCRDALVDQLSAARKVQLAASQYPNAVFDGGDMTMHVMELCDILCSLGVKMLCAKLFAQKCPVRYLEGAIARLGSDRRGRPIVNHLVDQGASDCYMNIAVALEGQLNQVCTWEGGAEAGVVHLAAPLPPSLSPDPCVHVKSMEAQPLLATAWWNRARFLLFRVAGSAVGLLPFGFALIKARFCQLGELIKVVAYPKGMHTILNTNTDLKGERARAPKMVSTLRDRCSRAFSSIHRLCAPEARHTTSGIRTEATITGVTNLGDSRIRPTVYLMLRMQRPNNGIVEHLVVPAPEVLKECEDLHARAVRNSMHVAGKGSGGRATLKGITLHAFLRNACMIGSWKILDEIKRAPIRYFHLLTTDAPDPEQPREESAEAIAGAHQADVVAQRAQSAARAGLLSSLARRSARRGARLSARPADEGQEAGEGSEVDYGVDASARPSDHVFEWHEEEEEAVEAGADVIHEPQVGGAALLVGAGDDANPRRRQRSASAHSSEDEGLAVGPGGRRVRHADHAPDPPPGPPPLPEDVHDWVVDMADIVSNLRVLPCRTRGHALAGHGAYMALSADERRSTQPAAHADTALNLWCHVDASCMDAETGMRARDWRNVFRAVRP